MTLEPGTLLNSRYRINAVLGQGGMGAVYRAQDENLGIFVAVKENLFLSEEYARQFQIEASILASLRHPALPRVGDYFSIVHQGQYLIMDYIDGEDLRMRIDRLGMLPERDVVLIGLSICDALLYLHTRPFIVVHRDIKPGNIKITPEGGVVLVDFGLAKIMQDGQITTTGARAMTPGYSPPEQYGTAHTDSRSDIYSLGATLYAGLTGIIPEDGLARATGKLKLTPLRQIDPRISRKLSAVIEKSLAVDPEDRYQTAEEFKKALLSASDLPQATQERPNVTPPPPELCELSKEQPSHVLAEQLAISSSSGRQNAQTAAAEARQRVRSRQAWIVIFSAIILTAALTLSYFFPSIPTAIVASLFGTAITQQPPTQVAAVVDTIGVTPILSPVVPGMEGTATQTLPMATETLPAAGLTEIPQSTPTDGSGLSGPTTVAPKTGEIAFASDRTGILQIWMMDTNGNNQRQITRFEEGVCQPSWSPDGLKLAVISPCESEKGTYIYKKAKIYIVDLVPNEDGEEVPPKVLPKSSEQGDFDPAWSPDGKRIAFTSGRSGIKHIYVLNLEDDTIEELSDSKLEDIQPSWNPSGKQIVFTRQANNSHIWIMSDNGQTQFQFSSSGQIDDYWPVWSPTGQTILFSRYTQSKMPYVAAQKYEDRGKALEVKLAPKDGLSLGPMIDASLSADGQWVVYESWPDGRNHDIYTISIDGNTVYRLTTDPGIDMSPAWRPDIISTP